MPLVWAGQAARRQQPDMPAKHPADGAGNASPGKPPWCAALLNGMQPPQEMQPDARAP